MLSDLAVVAAAKLRPALGGAALVVLCACAAGPAPPAGAGLPWRRRTGRPWRQGLR
jgi:hypothetical protein